VPVELLALLAAVRVLVIAAAARALLDVIHHSGRDCDLRYCRHLRGRADSSSRLLTVLRVCTILLPEDVEWSKNLSRM
jgi:hypothetical protein